MRVLHVIDSLGVGGGAEHSLAAVLPLLRERGVENAVATIRPRVGGLTEDLRRDGFEVTVLPSGTWPGRVRALRRMIGRFRPDLVHATLFNACMVSRFACAGTDVPLVNSLVSTSYDPARVAALSAARWKLTLVRRADAVTGRRLVTRTHAVSQSVATQVETHLGLPPERITIIPRGRSAVSLGAPSPERRRRVRAELGVAQDAPLVLNVGRHEHAKHQPHLVRAFDGVVAQIPQALLLIAGREGLATADIHRELSRSRAPQSMRLLGHRTDVADLYVAADVFAFPSLYEGAAGSIIEAMALGCPIVGSDAVAVREVLQDGALGMIVPRDDAAGLTAALVGLLQDRDRRAAFAEMGIAHFQQRYRLDAVAEATMRMYREVVEEGR